MTTAGGNGQTLLRPSTGWALVLGYIAVLVPARFTIVVAMANARGQSSPLTLGICLGLILAVVVLFSLAARGGRRAVLVLGAATFGPYLLFPMLWGPIAGPLAAAMPLTVAGPAGWLLFGGVLLADTVVGAVLHGPALPTVVSFVIIDMNMGLTLFALVRLAVLLTETQSANRQLAELEAANERLRAAGDLRRAIGDRLARILRASRRRPLTPAVLTGIAEISREAAAEARTVAAVPHEPLPAGRTDLPDESRRLSRWALTAMTVNIAVIVLNNVADSDTTTPRQWTVAVMAALTAVAFQLYHGVPRGSAPSAWRWTLPLHILVVSAAALYLGDGTLAALLGLAVANTLLWLPMRWSVPAVAVAAVAAGFLLRLYPDVGGYELYQIASTIGISVGVFAFNRFPEAAAHLRGLRMQIARSAVVAERLRVARDVHDLLGSTLSAITLKAELARRAVGDDPGKAARLVEDVRPLAVRGLADVRSIASGGAELSLREEIASARSLLDSAGVEVRAHAADVEPCPVLATVLREAVTNVVRHSAARRCTITVETDGDEVRLRVANDGVTRALPGTGGSGLASLTARVESAGGTFTAGDEGDGAFALVAVVPRYPWRRPEKKARTSPA
ncbi:histidine kinase [Streptosporangium sp. NBC_01639]|uniref:sensor histidine kinase n=1 Tax=Streptosporangium sp. NBC_01639 TaxID=2975948 RepID=UPI00386F5E6A|nr:histidine kinase [Streptosporangium sp. NBC_01639]